MNTIVARIKVSADDDMETADADEDAVLQLRDDLRELPEDVLVTRASDGPPPPPGARGGELIQAGVVLVTTLAQPEVLAIVLTYVGDWIKRRGRGRVEIEVDGHRLVLDHATAEERRALVDGYVRKVLTPDS